MDLYTRTSYELAKKLTAQYSTSFSMSSRLFDARIRNHIYAIYGMVRIADEIVDTFKTAGAQQMLQDFQDQVLTACKTQHSTNPIIHAFADTAHRFGIDEALITPFFDSMETDLHAKTFSQQAYRKYIYGSAEVIGLMCLKVFVDNDAEQYQQLQHGAARLGAAYQKVNFLRDFAADHHTLGRVYFPGVTYKSFSEHDKQSITADIRKDFSETENALHKLPTNSRRAVTASYAYYRALLNKIDQTPVATLKQQRIRISNSQKVYLLARARVGL